VSERSVPVCDLTAQYQAIRDEIDAAIARVVRRGWFILGEECDAFEEEFARYCGAAYGIGVGSGTEALHLILVAIGAGEGREVIAPAMTAIPTIAAIAEAGAKPILVDVVEETGNIDPKLLEAKITTRTSAVVAVHLYGQCADVTTIGGICERSGIALIEDAAQAHGARVGNRKAGRFGRAAAFSFYPSKNLGAFGDAGMITTDDSELAERLRRLRNYGQQQRDRSLEIGFNSRLDEIQAAILRAKLPHLDHWNGRRRELTDRYRTRLQGLPLRWNEEIEGRHHIRHLCVVALEERDAFRQFLADRGIRTQIHYPIPVHLQPAYSFLGHREGDFPVAERLASSVVSLPLYPELPESSQDRVIEAAREWFRRNV
jgi:dTDP-4-amino-4,6-dideoxygalactose transaminase